MKLYLPSAKNTQQRASLPSVGKKIFGKQGLYRVFLALGKDLICRVSEKKNSSNNQILVATSHFVILQEQCSGGLTLSLGQNPHSIF
jgi:hypothetical protein